MHDHPPTRWASIPLAADLRVKVDTAAPALSPHLANEVAAIWHERRHAQPALFNGRVFSADRVSRDEISGYWTSYDRILAQMSRPELYPGLRLHPLAVVGLLHMADGILLGRRAAQSTYQPGWWHTPPAGSIESRQGEAIVDLAAQILAEMEEELGLTPDQVSVLGPFRATRHPGTRVIDIAIHLRTALPFAELHRIWQARGNDEYDRLAVIPPGQNPADLIGPNLLPGTRQLWENGIDPEPLRQATRPRRKPPATRSESCS